MEKEKTELTDGQETELVLSEKEETPVTEEPAKEPTAAETKKEKKKKKGKAASDAETGKGVRVGGAIIALLIFVALAAGAALGGALWGKSISESDTILPNVFIGDINLGEMTVEQATEALDAAGWEKSMDGELLVTMPENVSIRLNYLMAGSVFRSEDAAELAYEYGHDGDWFDNLFKYIHSLAAPTELSGSEKSLNEEYIRDRIARGARLFEMRTADTGYVLDEEKSLMTLRKGVGQLRINQDDLFEKAAQALLAGESELNYNQLSGEIKTPDFEAMYTELAAEPQNAVYDPETESILPSVRGVDFDPAVAKTLWDTADVLGNVEIPVIISNPEISTEYLEEILFRDLLGSKSTYYWGSTGQRMNNINLVANKLNGLILMPGDVFSYNGFVGERTEEAGFEYAAAYNGDKVEQQIGGGICQVSSTLYFATLCANLEIVSRTCHGFVVTYLPYGLDATVSWPDPDFQFCNNRDFPIMIKAWADDDSRCLTIEIWGSNLDGTYVEPVSGWWPIYDETYPEVQIGWGAISYRRVYNSDGYMIDNIEEDYSKYDLHPEDIKWPEEEEEGEDTGGGEDSGEAAETAP